MSNEDFKNLEKTYEQSQNDFEKQLSYISVGALGLTITFFDKIVPVKSETVAIWLIITAWSALALSLLINLFSHQLASVFLYKTMKEINDENENYKTRLSRDRIIQLLNSIHCNFFIIKYLNMAKSTKDVKVLESTKGRTAIPPKPVVKPVTVEYKGGRTAPPPPVKK
jgi:hypothetical protein